MEELRWKKLLKTKTIQQRKSFLADLQSRDTITVLSSHF